MAFCKQCGTQIPDGVAHLHLFPAFQVLQPAERPPRGDERSGVRQDHSGSSLGTAAGAVFASMRMRLDQAPRVMPLGIVMGVCASGPKREAGLMPALPPQL